MVVQHRGPLVEAASMPGIPKSEPMEIEMMAELMAERAQECSERCDLLPNGRSHPDSNQHGRRVVVAEELGSPASAAPQRSSRKYMDTAARDSVEI